MSLKRQLDDPRSPVRQFFADRLPHVDEPRAQWKAALAGKDPLIPVAPDGDPIPWDSIGHAVGALIAWSLTPGVPHWAELGADVVERYRRSTAGLDLLAVLRPMEDAVTGVEPEVAARIAWVAGALDQTFRFGSASGDVPAAFVDLFAATDHDDLLARCPSPWVADVQAVAAASEQLLEPFRSRPLVGGHTYAGSLAVGGADGDAIAGHTLLEIKAIKDPRWRMRTLQQVVAYTLLDWTDAYGFDSIAILLPRFGVTVAWRLNDLLGAMAGHPSTRDQLSLELRDRLTPRR
jgi:hypothetical protein